jgi:hypothetical protein
MDITKSPFLLWFLGGIALLYFGVVVYALYRGRDVRASLKIPFAMLSLETKSPGGRESKVPK